MNKELEKYVAIVDFLGETLGQDTEIVLHDLTNLEQSIVAIKNGHVSGRKVGDAVTNFVLKSLKDFEVNKINYVCNYKGRAKNGNTLNSSSMYIFDSNNNLIGMLCINRDCTNIISMIDMLKTMISFKENEKNSELREIFTTTPEELTRDIIPQVIQEIGIPPDRMTQEEKISVIRKLHSIGTFFLKGAVYDTAQVMNCSEATVYRYLSMIKKEISDKNNKGWETI